METKLYIGNLSYDTTEEDLRSLFEEAGAVASVELIKDRDTGRSKGFAFVSMDSQADAEAAISKFNGYELADRQIKVDIAKPREERPAGSWYTDRGSRGSDKRSQRGPRRR